MALTTLTALAPNAAAYPVDEEACTPTSVQGHPVPVDESCVRVYGDPSRPCVGFWLVLLGDDFGGAQCQPF